MGRKRARYLILQKGSPLKFETEIRRYAPHSPLLDDRHRRGKSVLFPASTKSMSDGTAQSPLPLSTL